MGLLNGMDGRNKSFLGIKLAEKLIKQALMNYQSND
jgi:hypothetical protein